MLFAIFLSEYTLSKDITPVSHNIKNESKNTTSDKLLLSINDEELYKKALEAINQGLKQKAKTYFQELLKRESTNQHQSELKKGIYYYQLGLIDNDKKLLEQAIPFIKKSIALEKNKIKSDQLEVGSYYYMLGRIALANDKYQDAIDYFKISSKTLEGNHDMSQSIINNFFYLALAYYYKEDYVFAQKNAEKSVALSLKIYGENHISTASSLGLLGKILYDSSKEKEALPIVIKAHTFFQKKYGEDYKTTRNLSGLLEKLKK